MSRFVCCAALPVLVVLAGYVGQASAAEDAGPLVIRPDNTVILYGDGRQAAFLQYYLIKGYVGDPQAEPYHYRQKVDRSGSEFFPALNDRRDLTLPADKNILAVGPTRFLADPDVARLKGVRNACLYRRDGRVVVIAGSFGAKRFLIDVAGIRLYAPEDLWLSRRTGQALTIGKLDCFFEPSISIQPSHGHEPRNREWRDFNHPVGMSIYAGHNVSNLFPPSQYGQTHPEIYEMHGGKRVVPKMVKGQHPTWHPCFSAEVLPDLAMEQIRRIMARDRKPTYISLFPMDYGIRCQCPECLKSVEKYGGYSQLYHAFVIEVARRCKQEFPDLLITAAANYSGVNRPPVGLRYPGNVAVNYLLKSYQFVEPGLAEQKKRTIREYSDLGARWRAHDWAFQNVTPRLWNRQYANFLQWAASHGMIGCRVEWSAGEHWYIEGANYWIMFQIYWDPHQDVDLLWRQYCDDMYGPASETMFRFYDTFAQRTLYRRDYAAGADWGPVLFLPADVAHQRALLERAVDQTRDDPLIQKRLAHVMRYFRCHELFALAGAVPYQLDRQFEGTDVNQALLAWYARLEGDPLGEAIDFYHNKRTVPPDFDGREKALGAVNGVIALCTQPKASLLKQIRNLAFERAADIASPSRRVEAVVAESKKILRQNLPADARPDNVRALEVLTEKVLHVPTADAMPTFDGRMTEKVWERGAVLKDFTVMNTLATPPDKARGRVLRVGDHLLVGLEVEQAETVWATTPADVQTGTSVWREAGAEIFLTPVLRQGQTEEDLTKVHAIVTCLGAGRSWVGSTETRDGFRWAATWDKGTKRYVLEIAVPLKTAYHDFAQEKLLSFNVMQNVFNANSYTATRILGWSPIFRTAHSYDSRSFIVLD